MVTGIQFGTLARTTTRFAMLLLLGLFMLAPQPGKAENKLSASVDRNKLYETETLTYELRGELDIEPGFGGLFSFGRSQLSDPKIPGLERDFEILDRQQKMNMQTINGNTQSTVVWRYTLAPKRSGTLTIPAAEYENVKAQPLSIEVLAGQSPRDANTPPLVFLEVDTDKSDVYVQEQVKFTVRLYSAGNLVAGDLDQPEALDAIIEPLGETKVYYRMAHNQRYEVREKNYLLYPQKSGELALPALSFSGTVIDAKKRRRVRIRETSDALTLTVKSPPSSFSGDTWLPATSLHLREQWDRTPDTLQVGDSVTRTLEIQALGLLASALPPLPASDTENFKIYPDQAQTETIEHESGAQSLRREVRALVAVTPGAVTLPEIRIPWWDTVNNVERIAVLPSRTLNIEGSAAYQPPAASAPAITERTEETPELRQQTRDTAASTTTDTATTPTQHFWWLLTALLCGGWAFNVWWLLRRQSTQATSVAIPAERGAPWSALMRAIKDDAPDMTKLLIAWVQSLPDARGTGRTILGISDLEAYDRLLFEQARAFETARYAPEGATSPRYDRDRLIKHLKTLRDKAKQTKTQDSALMAFYPNEQKR